MKKITAIFIAAGLLLTAAGSILYADDMETYNDAIGYINNYDIEKGLQGLNKVVYSKTADDDIKVKSYFWIAFIKMFDGDEGKAGSVMGEMLLSGLGADYDTARLPVEISRDNKLMGIYDKEKAKYLKDEKEKEKKAAKLLKAADKYFSKNDLEKAKGSLEEVLILDPDNSRAVSMMKRIEGGDSPDPPLQAASSPASKDQAGAAAAVENNPDMTTVIPEDDFNPVETYNLALGHINNYEMESAYKLMAKIVGSKTAHEHIKTKAYFWTAFLDLFEGKEREARKTIVDMLSEGLGIDYDVKKLPDELSQNIQLMKMYYDEKEEYIYKNEHQAPAELVKQLKKARKAYLSRDLDRAEVLVDAIMSTHPENRPAQELKTKIIRSREIRISVRKRLEEEFFRNAKFYYSSGNMLGTMQETNKVLKFNPKHQKAYTLFQEAYKNINKIVRDSNERDRAVFQDAVNYYLEGNYEAASLKFRKLQRFIREADVLLSQSVANIIQRENLNRSMKFYRHAQKDFNNSRFQRAKENLQVVLMLDKYCVEALILLEEVRQELMKY
ncbi:MAG: hypothetical protein ABIH89_08725 [Elusimicrobiota bacterium]